MTINALKGKVCTQNELWVDFSLDDYQICWVFI